MYRKLAVKRQRGSRSQRLQLWDRAEHIRGIIARDGVHFRFITIIFDASSQQLRSGAANQEDSMYAAIRQGKAEAGMAEELTRRIKEGAKTDGRSRGSSRTLHPCSLDQRQPWSGQ